MSCRKKFALAVAVFGAAVVLIAVIHHYQLRAAVDAYRTELKAKGELLDVAQLLPPPVPPEENSADTFRKFAVLLAADNTLLTSNPYAVDAMEMIAPGKALVCWQQPDVRDFSETNSWGDFSGAISKNATAFELLRQITDKPDFDFEVKYDEGPEYFSDTNLYLAEVDKASIWLEAAALCDLHQKDTASAVENLRAILALVKATRNERLIISESVRLALVNIATAVNWEILQSPGLADKQLAELQSDWADLEFIQAHENIMAMERASDEKMVASWRNSSPKFRHYLEENMYGWNNRKLSSSEKFRIGISGLFWRSWWSYPDELRLLKATEIILKNARTAETNNSLLAAYKNQSSALETLEPRVFINYWNAWQIGLDHDMDLHNLLAGDINFLGYIFNRVMVAETEKQMTITAIALKRFQLKHGEYPGKVSDLVPEFLATMPLDPVDGQQLRYRRNADGTFLLYSVAENGLDDGGDPSLLPGHSHLLSYWPNFDVRDWVWPQPATAEEIQKYYADQAAKAK